MPLQPKTVAFFKYLHNNPAVRRRIRADQDKTLLYSGSDGVSEWKTKLYRAVHPDGMPKDEELETPMFAGTMRTSAIGMKRDRGELLDKIMLPDVLDRIDIPSTGHSTLRAYVDFTLLNAPWRPDGALVWRALSGIFAANASGKVSFMIGDHITRETKIFASTELSVLSRNTKLDPITQDLVAYYLRCIADKQPGINFNFISA